MRYMKIFFGLLLVLAGMFLWLGLIVGWGTLGSGTAVIGVLGAFLFFSGVYLFYRGQHPKGPKVKKQKLDPNQPFPVVENPNIILRPRETCHIMEPIQIGRPKNVVTGYSGGYSGVSVRVTKGVSVRTGGNKGQPIRETIYEKYSGTFYVTSQRIIVNAQKLGFEKPITNLSSFELYSDGLNLMFGNSSYLIFTKNAAFDLAVIRTIIEVVNEEKTQKIAKTTDVIE